MAHSYPVLACLLEVALVLDHRLVSHSGGWLLELALGLRRSLGTQTHSGGVGAQPQRQLAIRQHRATSSQATRDPQARCPNSPRVPHGKTRTRQEAKSRRPRARARAAWALARLRPRPRLLERVLCRHQPGQPA